MICVIPHICKDVLENSDGNNMKQVNNVIKTLFHGLSDDEMSYNIDTWWIGYTDFNNNNGHFDGGDFICKSKYIQVGTSHLWHHKYSLPCKKVIDFVSCRGASEILGIGAAE